jgi:hypothetical protein
MADLTKYKPPRRHPGGGPVERYNDMSGAFIEGALNNEFGRPVNIQYDGPVSKNAQEKTAFVQQLPAMARNAWTQGRDAAVKRFGGMGEHGLELAGLGMLALPVAHDLVSDPAAESPEAHKLKSLTELAGLGVLGISPLQHLRKP